MLGAVYISTWTDKNHEKCIGRKYAKFLLKKKKNRPLEKTIEDVDKLWKENYAKQRGQKTPGC